MNILITAFVCLVQGGCKAQNFSLVYIVIFLAVRIFKDKNRSEMILLGNLTWKLRKSTFSLLTPHGKRHK
jgi:hypothetical protein